MKRRSSTRPIGRLLRLERRLKAAGFALIAGVDEAGRGPLAGPVVAGAVILPDRYRFVERIDDSKRLSDAQRQRAFDELLRVASVGVGIIGERTIDRINIFQATRRAMESAVAGLPITPDYIIVDGSATFSASCPCEAVVSGDALSLSIAAASIVAKVTRDRIMHEYDAAYPEYGFFRHKGYPTRLHKAALADRGPSPVHRFTFEPVRFAASRRGDGH